MVNREMRKRLVFVITSKSVRKAGLWPTFRMLTFGSEYGTPRIRELTLTLTLVRAVQMVHAALASDTRSDSSASVNAAELMHP